MRLLALGQEVVIHEFSLHSPILTFSCRPLVVIGGSSDRNQEQMGAFQELPQVFKKSHCFIAAKYFMFTEIIVSLGYTI